MAFKAPDGTRVLGVLQTDSGVWKVWWTGDDRLFDYFGDGPESEWETVLHGDDAVFVDENDAEWLAHHLIPHEAEPLGEEAVGAASAETAFRRRAALLIQVRDSYATDAPGWAAFDGLVMRELAAADAMRERFGKLKGEG